MGSYSVRLGFATGYRTTGRRRVGAYWVPGLKGNEMRDETLAKAQLAMARRRAAAERLLAKPAVQLAVAEPVEADNTGYVRSRIVLARKR